LAGIRERRPGHGEIQLQLPPRGRKACAEDLLEGTGSEGIVEKYGRAAEKLSRSSGALGDWPAEGEFASGCVAPNLHQEFSSSGESMQIFYSTKIRQVMGALECGQLAADFFFFSEAFSRSLIQSIPHSFLNLGGVCLVRTVWISQAPT